MGAYLFLLVAIVTLSIPALVVCAIAFIMEPRLHRVVRPSGLPAWQCALIGLFGSHAIWWALMSWPLGPHGDYAPWQVILTGAVMVAFTIAGAVLARSWVSGSAAWTTAAIWGFSFGWGIWAVIPDETGQSGMGLFLLVIGLQVSLGFVWGCAALVRWLRASRESQASLQ